MDHNHKIIAVDFDGTLCYSNWPELGEPNTMLIDYLLQEKAAGNKLILWTCRASPVIFTLTTKVFLLIPRAACRELFYDTGRCRIKTAPFDRRVLREKNLFTTPSIKR